MLQITDNLLVFPRMEAIFEVYFPKTTVRNHTSIFNNNIMHEIKKKITFISHTMCIDFLKNKMQDKYNIILLVAVFAAPTHSLIHLPQAYTWPWAFWACPIHIITQTITDYDHQFRRRFTVSD